MATETKAGTTARESDPGAGAGVEQPNPIPPLSEEALFEATLKIAKALMQYAVADRREVLKGAAVLARVNVGGSAAPKQQGNNQQQQRRGG